MNENYSKLRRCACSAAIEAGNFLTSFFGQSDLGTQEKTSAEDLVTKADLGAERLLLEHLSENTKSAGFPNVGFLAEESGAGDLTQPVVFVIDPLDGTRYFARFSNRYAISIGVLLEGLLVAGVIYFPASSRVLHAELGSGAFEVLGKKERKLNARSLVNQALIANVRAYQDSPDSVNSIRYAIAERASRLEGYGPSTLALADQSSGMNDITLDIPSKRWDVAAASLLLQESGHLFFDLNNPGKQFQFDVFHQENIWPLAINPACKDWILEFV